MTRLEQVQSRIQACTPESIEVAAYCQTKAQVRGVDLAQAKYNLIHRQDGQWAFSAHSGIPGARITVDFRVSRKKVHRYILEANDAIYLINVIVIYGKQLKRHEP